MIIQVRKETIHSLQINGRLRDKVRNVVVENGDSKCTIMYLQENLRQMVVEFFLFWNKNLVKIRVSFPLSFRVSKEHMGGGGVFVSERVNVVESIVTM